MEQVNKDMGVPASPSGHSDEPASGLAAIAGSVPNAEQLAIIAALIERCERGEEPIWELLAEVAEFALAGDFDHRMRVMRFLDFGADMDAAIALLPAGSVWRKYTDRCVTVYGRSPYGAMQERYDGFADREPLALAAGFLRLLAAPLLKAQAMSARQGHDRNGHGAKPASAVPNGDAPNPSNSLISPENPNG